MRTLKTILLSGVAALFMVACQSDDIESTPVNPPLVPGENETVVDFALDVTAIPEIVETRTFTPDYPNHKEKFFIYAFRKDDKGAFKYEKTISTAAMEVKYDATKKVATLSGQDIVRVGIYKFLATYGTEQGGVTPQTWTDLAKGVLTLKSQLGDEIFLPIGKDLSKDSDFKEFDFSISGSSGTNPKVTETLKRAVSRVDIVLVSAKKTTLTGYPYMEQSYVGTESDILGGNDMAITVDMKFNDLTWTMDYLGAPATKVTATKPLNVKLADLKRGTGGKITIGTYTWVAGTDKYANSPIFGDKYTAFDAVKPADIRKGGAHIFGPYLFPNAATLDKVSTLESLVITGTKGTEKIIRTITIPEKLKIEQNKVTLIKVYVVQGGTPITPPVDPTDPTKPKPDPDPTNPVSPIDPTDPTKPINPTDPTNPKDPETPPTPPNVFETNVTFEVVIETAWLGSHHVTGEIN